MHFYCTTEDKQFNFGLNKIQSPNNEWNIYFDNDWVKDSNSIYKGIDSNWCRVIFDNKLTIKHNKLREYPIYYTKNSISNFYKHGEHLPVDGIINYNNQKINIKYNNNFSHATGSKYSYFFKSKNPGVLLLFSKKKQKY